MNVEENLDHVIDQLMEGETPVAPGDETLAPLVAVATMLAQLRATEPPPVFAGQLETSLCTRLRSL